MLAALVTCVALDQCGWYLVSGSQDCTCVIWDISHLSSAPIKPVQTLYGHDQPITTVAIATELDMVASGSKVNTLYYVHLNQNCSFFDFLGHWSKDPMLDREGVF